MDRYNERLIKARTTTSSILFLSMAIAFTGASLIFVLLSPPLGFLLVAVGIALIVYLKDGLSLEYEIILTNGDIDVSKIIAKKRRKNVKSIEASAITRMADAEDERVANDLSLGTYKVKKFVGKNMEENGGRPIAIYVGEEENQLIYVLDLDEDCIEHLNQVLKTKSSVKRK